LAGTDIYGVSDTDPVAENAFSVDFETAVPGYDEMLLTTGDCVHWMVMSKDAAIGSFYGSNVQRQVKRSHTSSTAYNIAAYRRQGQQEDPWLQYTPGHSQEFALYSEGNYNTNSGNGEGKKYQGLNVYIRVKDGDPNPPASQPDGGTTTDCATINSVSGKWSDTSCTEENFFVCETKR